MVCAGVFAHGFRLCPLFCALFAATTRRRTARHAHLITALPALLCPLCLPLSASWFAFSFCAFTTRRVFSTFTAPPRTPRDRFSAVHHAHAASLRRVYHLFHHLHRFYSLPHLCIAARCVPCLYARLNSSLLPALSRFTSRSCMHNVFTDCADWTVQQDSFAFVRVRWFVLRLRQDHGFSSGSSPRSAVRICSCLLGQVLRFCNHHCCLPLPLLSSLLPLLFSHLSVRTAWRTRLLAPRCRPCAFCRLLARPIYTSHAHCHLTSPARLALLRPRTASRLCSHLSNRHVHRAARALAAVSDRFHSCISCTVAGFCVSRVRGSVNAVRVYHASPRHAARCSRARGGNVGNGRKDGGTTTVWRTVVLRVACPRFPRHRHWHGSAACSRNASAPSRS